MFSPTQLEVFQPQLDVTGHWTPQDTGIHAFRGTSRLVLSPPRLPTKEVQHEVV